MVKGLNPGAGVGSAFTGEEQYIRVREIAHNSYTTHHKAGHAFKNCELTKLGNKHETDHAFSRGVDKIRIRMRPTSPTWRRQLARAFSRIII